MKRRKFVAASATFGAMLPFASRANNKRQTEDKELYELRTYEFKFRGSQGALIDYLKNDFSRLLTDAGCGLMLFDEIGDSEPRKIVAVIKYPSTQAYIMVQKRSATEAMDGADDYHQIPEDKTIFNRYSSWLLSAFDGLPKMMGPVEGASVFELRTYEGYSENAVQRKIKMFNVEEIDLFKKLDLRPVFFGEMIAGPYRPCLTYMINFKDMEERNANWQTFIQHPEWKAMASKEEYANTVSNIRKVFLKPI